MIMDTRTVELGILLTHLESHMLVQHKGQKSKNHDVKSWTKYSSRRLVTSTCRLVSSTCHFFVWACHLVVSTRRPVVSYSQLVVLTHHLFDSACRLVVSSFQLVVLSCQLVVLLCQLVISSSRHVTSRHFKNQEDSKTDDKLDKLKYPRGYPFWVCEFCKFANLAS